MLQFNATDPAVLPFFIKNICVTFKICINYISHNAPQLQTGLLEIGFMLTAANVTSRINEEHATDEKYFLTLIPRI